MFVAGKVGSSSFVLGLGTWWGGGNGPCWEAMARGDLYLPGWVVLTVGAHYKAMKKLRYRVLEH